MSWTITGTQRYQPAALLDQFPGAAAAYSLRNLVGTSNPAVVRVRRDNDDAEQDFTATEVSDGTLAAWVGAGNDGFVRTWYDQSGNSRHAERTTTSAQPQIVDTGSLILDGSKPAIEFNGTSMNMTAVFSALLAQPNTFFSVAQPRSFTELKYIVDGSAGNARHVLDISTNQEAIIFAGQSITSSTSHGLQRRLLTGLFNTSSSQLWQDSASVATGNTGTDAVSGFTIGSRFTNQGFWDGYMQEIVLYSSNQSTNLAAIEANINAHYNIF